MGILVPASSDARALKAQIADLITALDQQGATSADLARVYALSVTAYRAANLRARVVAQVPFRVMDRSGQPLDDHPLNALFRDNAALYDIQERSELAHCFWGHNLLYKQRGFGERISGLRWMNPQLYRAHVDRQYGLLGFHLPASRAGGVPAYIARRDAVYTHGVDFDDDFDGVSPAEAAFDAAGIETEARLTGLSFLRNRAVPLAILQPKDPLASTPSPSGRRKLAAFLREAMQGARNAGKTYISSGRWEWVAVQQKFDEISLDIFKDQTREDIAMAFDVPLDLILSNSSTYAELYQSNRNWVEYFVKTRCVWYARHYTLQVAAEFGRDLKLEPDFSAVIREDAQRETETVNSQLSGGYLTLYEAQVRTKAQQPDEKLKGIYLVNGLPMTAEAIVELAQPGRAQAQLLTLTSGDGSNTDSTQLESFSDQLPPQPPALRSLPDEIFKELRDCVRVVGRKGADYAFRSRTLPPDVIALVQLLTITGDDVDAVLTAVRSYYLDRAHDLAGMKAYGDTERRYRAVLMDLIRAAFARRTDRPQLGDLGRAEISAGFEAAFKDGLADAGVPVQRLEVGEAALVREQSKSERRYWTRLSNDMFAVLLPLDADIKAKTQALHATSDVDQQQTIRAEILALKKQLIAARDGFLKRLDLWAQSLKRMYHQGLLSGRGNPFLRWDADLTAEHCATCVAAHGQVHRASTWDAAGLHPGADSLECVHSADGVPVCKCGFTVVEGPERGNIDRIPSFAARKSLPPSNPGYVVLYLDSIEAVAQVQQELAAQRPQMQPEPVEHLHLTLAYSPDVDAAAFEQAFEVVRTAALATNPVDVSSHMLSSFDGEDGQRALVLRINVPEPLRALQHIVYEAFRSQSVELSPYSVPEDWQPHITLGYEPDVQPSTDQPVDVRCTTGSLVFARDDYQAVHTLEAAHV